MKYKRSRKTNHSTRGEYRKQVVILGEGETEFQYFRHIKDLYQKSVTIRSIKPNRSSPKHLLNQMENALRKISLGADDEAWLVIDHDGREDSEFVPLVKWKKQNKKFGLAVSNRDFEYWKLLHFEDGDGFGNDHNKYHRKLAEYLGVSVRDLKKEGGASTLNKFTNENFARAIKSAKRRERITGKIIDWPKNFGNSNVYVLAEVIHSS